MSLNKTALQAALVSVFTNQYDGSLSSEQSQEIQNLSSGIADAVDVFVKTATVTTPLGVAVQVVPATGTGATTAPGIGSIT